MEESKEYYNEVYRSGGAGSVYLLPAEEIKFYYPNWKITRDFIIRNKIDNIVDLGCGPGHFSSLFSGYNVTINAYDFSNEAISQAKERNKTNKNITFHIEDLKNTNLKDRGTFFTAFEFLEHIEWDLDIISKISSGSTIIFSVPSYDAKGHVRFFNNEKEVENRYSKLLNLDLLNIHQFGKQKIFLYKGEKI